LIGSDGRTYVLDLFHTTPRDILWSTDPNSSARLRHTLVTKYARKIAASKVFGEATKGTASKDKENGAHHELDERKELASARDNDEKTADTDSKTSENEMIEKEKPDYLNIFNSVKFDVDAYTAVVEQEDDERYVLVLHHLFILVFAMCLIPYCSVSVSI
jgi:hypothetical protein